MHGEELVEDLRAKEVVIRHGELHAHQQGEQTGDQEKDERAQQVHDTELLVIDRGDPAQPDFARFELEGLGAERLGNGRIVHFCVSGYATSARTSSSLSLKLGMLLPGVKSSGSCSQAARFSGVFSSAPAASVRRLATCVWSGPTLRRRR